MFSGFNMPSRGLFVTVGTVVIQFDALEKALVDRTSMHLASHRYLSKAGCGYLPYANQTLIVNFPARKHLNLSLCP